MMYSLPVFLIHCFLVSFSTADSGLSRRTNQVNFSDHCASRGLRVCGEGCVESDWTCCPDHLGGCSSDEYCLIGDDGIYTCCPNGQKCYGSSKPTTLQTGSEGLPLATATATEKASSEPSSCSGYCAPGKSCWYFSDGSPGCCALGSKPCGTEICIPATDTCCEGSWNCPPGFGCLKNGNAADGCVPIGNETGISFSTGDAIPSGFTTIGGPVESSPPGSIVEATPTSTENTPRSSLQVNIGVGSSATSNSTGSVSGNSGAASHNKGSMMALSIVLAGLVGGFFIV